MIVPSFTLYPLLYLYLSFHISFPFLYLYFCLSPLYAQCLIYFLLMLRVQLSPKVVQSNLLSSDDESAAVSKGSPVDQFSLNWEEKLIENLNEVIRTILGQGFSLIVHVWQIWQMTMVWLYRVFIKYCVFFRVFQNIPDSVFPRCQFVYTKQAGRKPTLLQN